MTFQRRHSSYRGYLNIRQSFNIVNRYFTAELYVLSQYNAVFQIVFSSAVRNSHQGLKGERPSLIRQIILPPCYHYEARQKQASGVFKIYQYRFFFKKLTFEIIWNFWNFGGFRTSRHVWPTFYSNFSRVPIRISIQFFVNSLIPIE